LCSFCTFRKLTSSDRFVLGPQRDDRIVVENTRDNERSETIGTVSISNILRTDDGLYECIATNEASYIIIYVLVQKM
jgi:neurocan core protein